MAPRAGWRRKLIFAALKAFAGALLGALSLLAWTLLPALILQVALASYARTSPTLTTGISALLQLLYPLLALAAGLGAASTLASGHTFSPLIRLAGRTLNIWAFTLTLNFIAASYQMPGVNISAKAALLTLAFGPAKVEIDFSTLLLTLFTLYACGQTILDFYSHWARAIIPHSQQ